MSRPFRRHSVAELQSLFENFQTYHPTKLLELRDELLQRSTQKAEDLLVMVDMALARFPKDAVTPKEPPQQLTLTLPSSGSAPNEPKELAPAPPASAGVPFPSAGPPKSDDTGKAIADRVPAKPSMTVTDAAKVLGVSANAKWEQVEEARRGLVVKSMASANSPSQSLQATRINQAYLSLFMSRQF